jgi:hypothetical protein
MKQFIISEQEKQRILEMHQNATSKQYLNEDLSQVILLSLTLQYNLAPGNIKKYSPTVFFSADISTHNIKTIRQISLFNQIEVGPSYQSLKGNIINGQFSLTPEQINILKPKINKGPQVLEGNMVIAEQGTQFGVKPTIIEKQMPTQK